MAVALEDYFRNERPPLGVEPDLAEYPEFLPGVKANVFDPVGEVFYVVADDSGWNRESWDVKSVPTEERVQRRFTATDFLGRGR